MAVNGKSRRSYKGAPVSNTLGGSGLALNATSITLAAAISGWSTSGTPFFVVIDPGTSKEEKLCVIYASSTTLTVVDPAVTSAWGASVAGRGVDDTVDRAHDVGAVIYPVFTATDANHANELVSKYANAGSVVYQGSGTPGTFTELAVGTAGQALKVNAGATAPEWGQLAAAGIADGAVTSAKILDGTIVLGDLAAALQAFLVPVGTINAYAGATAPTGYLLCDGTSTTGYAALAALVGATTPDMRGLFPIGKTASSTGSTLLGTGGSTTIAEANLPVHSHANTAAFTGSSVNTGSTDPSHTHTYNEPAFSTRSLQTGSVSITLSSGTFTPNTSTNSSAAHTHTVTAAGTVAMTNASTGSGTAYFQPFIAVNYIIKHD